VSTTCANDIYTLTIYIYMGEVVVLCCLTNYASFLPSLWYAKCVPWQGHGGSE
jgi:hypothetical protein